MRTGVLAAVLASTLSPTDAWYLPGVAPHDFFRGEKVDLKVNKLTSTRTQVQARSFKTTQIILALF
jgi:transmembrane 9 superfamily protein 2/4